MYPFTEPEVRHLRINTPGNLACMAKSDAIVEMIQIHAYLEDVPEVGRRDFRRYPLDMVILSTSIDLDLVMRLGIEIV